MSARLPRRADSLQTDLVLDRNDILWADRNSPSPVARRSHVEHQVEQRASRLGHIFVVGISLLCFLACILSLLG